MYDAYDFERDTNVSRETLEAYHHWHALLLKWNKSINLVQGRALEHFWERHALDSHQITKLIPSCAQTVLDMGSGAGFPGVAVAIALTGREGAQVTLVDSVGKKATFLRTVIRELGLPAKASSERVEALDLEPVDVITARAFAPLPRLLDYAAPFWKDDTVAILLKGRQAESEIEDARETYDFEADLSVSLTDPEGRIVVIRGLKSKAEIHSERLPS